MDEANLFGVKRKAPRRQPAVPGADIQRLVGVWVGLFERRFGEKPIVTKRDGAALKRLVAHAGAQAVERRLGLYLGLEDAYLAQQGYPLGLMLGAWNRLVAQDRPERSRVPDVDRTAAYLRNLKRRDA